MLATLRLVLIFGLSAALLSKLDAQRSAQGGLLHDYYPSFCRSAPYPERNCEFVIFREGSQSTSIALSFRLELLAYSRSGRTLYTLSPITRPICVERIDLNPPQVTTAICPVGLAVAFAFTVSPDTTRVLVSGQFRGDGVVRCGVFQTDMNNGEVKEVLNGEDCKTYNYQHSWTSLSLAPDSSRGIGLRMHQLDLFEIGSGESRTRAIAQEILAAAWSPDGRWIAAVDRRGRTQLIDANDFKVKRTLGETEAKWSPDSRYLLSVKECSFPLAVNGVGTIRAIDINTGKATEIRSSRCQVDNGSTGWVTVPPAAHGGQDQ